MCGNHACIAALQAAVVYGMQNIVVETESQTLVKALQMCEYDLALGGVLFRETKFILSTSFNSSSVIHGYRSSQKKIHGYRSCNMHPLPAFVNNLSVSDYATT